jgi:hypothetical protein
MRHSTTFGRRKLMMAKIPKPMLLLLPDPTSTSTRMQGRVAMAVLRFLRIHCHALIARSSEHRCYNADFEKNEIRSSDEMFLLFSMSVVLTAKMSAIKEGQF